MWERRKFLSSLGGEPILFRFAGLGAIGERKLADAEALYSEGLTPEPIALVHGFLAERWLGDARRLREREKPVAEIGAYIARRARLLPAMRDNGASARSLLAMARRNIALEFGEDVAAEADRWEPRIDVLDRSIVRVRTDNKMDRHEWLRSPDGSLIKTDAVDHCQSHDLIGCQGVEWDVAGAIAEFDLNDREAEQLVVHVENYAFRLSGELLEFYRLAYLAFRLGQTRLGAEQCGCQEQRRLQALAEDYAGQVRGLLSGAGCGAREPNSRKPTDKVFR